MLRINSLVFGYLLSLSVILRVCLYAQSVSFEHALGGTSFDDLTAFVACTGISQRTVTAVFGFCLVVFYMMIAFTIVGSVCGQQFSRRAGEVVVLLIISEGIEVEQSVVGRAVILWCRVGDDAVLFAPAQLFCGGVSLIGEGGHGGWLQQVFYLFGHGM